MVPCEYKVGLLSLSTCGEPATAQCAQCGQGACLLHQRMKDGVPYCVACFMTTASEEDAKREGLEDDYERDRTYRTTGYGGAAAASGYSKRDYDTFDRDAQPAAAAGDEPLDGKSLQDS